MPLLMCPNDDAAMQTMERGGVQFDMCPTCRGVWLDRGELDKIVERSGAEDAKMRERYAPPPERGGYPDGRGYRRDRDDDDDDRMGGFGGAGGFLGRLFD